MGRCFINLRNEHSSGTSSFSDAMICNSKNLEIPCGSHHEARVHPNAGFDLQMSS